MPVLLLAIVAPQTPHNQTCICTCEGQIVAAPSRAVVRGTMMLCPALFTASIGNRAGRGFTLQFSRV